MAKTYNYDKELIVSPEEKPLIEFPALMWIFVVFSCLCLALSLLFLPLYMGLIAVVGIALAIGIFFNPFISVPLYLAGAYIRPMTFAPQLVKYQLPVIGAFAVLLAWLFHIMIYRDFKMPQSKQLKFLLLFAIIAVFSSTAHWQETSFMFLDLAKVLILYFLVANLVKTKRHVMIMLFFLLTLGAIVALYGVYQHIHGIGQVIKGGILRIGSFEGNPNYLAMDLVILIPMVLGLFLNGRSVFTKTLLLSLFFLFLGTIMLTYSRAGLLGLGVVLFLCVWKFFKGKQKISYLFLLLAILMIILPYLPVSYIERAKSMTDLTEGRIGTRIEGFIVGSLLIKDHPFIGVGLGRLPFAYWQKAIMLPDIERKFAWLPHNIFMEVGTELGAFALIFFLILLFYIFRDLIEAVKIFKNNNEELLAMFTQTLTIGLFGFLACASFAAAVRLKLFWILGGFSIALRQLAIEYKKKNENKA